MTEKAAEAADAPEATYAFKCAHCGALEPAEAAGDNATPAACHICGRGVRFDPITGLKTHDTDNWIVLSKLGKSELNDVLEFHSIPKRLIVDPLNEEAPQ